MRFGICAPPEHTRELAAAGFAYVEWPLRSIAALDDREYAALRKVSDSQSVRVEAFNVMLPGTIKVTGPETELAELEQYLEGAFGRAAELGGSVVVFGSGGSRTVSEGWEHGQAMEQFEEACRLAGGVAARHRLTIAIEPLNPGETNLVNTVREAVGVAERVAHPSVRVLSDLYHVDAGGEPFEDTTFAGGLLAHVHVATPQNRSIPLPGRSEDVLERYFRALLACGYDGRVSVEGTWSPDQLAQGAAHLRETWARVSGNGGT